MFLVPGGTKSWNGRHMRVPNSRGLSASIPSGRSQTPLRISGAGTAPARRGPASGGIAAARAPRPADARSAPNTLVLGRNAAAHNPGAGNPDPAHIAPARGLDQVGLAG